ncbi:CHAT domain-containing protein [Vitiosangium sp. GDMCC 1.1324]|uniref:nSTAND1 domain-containing NTPase n=1 Tax=Vitiosangium sp. (strain GDMCC 1.1324) TaxID=2138576 RepID=UPI00130EF83E|nr:CHAT domain-containing protein [Vitiosangium sp. GDMCC 1.1324]
MQNEPLVLTLELSRKDSSAEPFAFHFQKQEYLRRRADGSLRSASFPWSQGLLDDLSRLERRDLDLGLIQRLGHELRRFLEGLDWGRDEAELHEALSQQREVHLTVRSAAAEMHALPWELLMLRDSGQHFGQHKGCSLHYEWTGASEPPRTEVTSPSEGRILFAWSGAGGDVPASAHLRVLRDACRRSGLPFDEARDVLAQVSLEALSRELDRSRSAREPVSVLHLLCHGGQKGGTDGLMLEGDSPGPSKSFVDAHRLGEVLGPHAGTVRMVVLCACQGGHERLGSPLGGVAQALHRAGIPAVVASRLRLSTEGSLLLTESLFGSLLGVPVSPEAPLEAPGSVEAALAAARGRLRESGLMEWASLQLYARARPSPGLRPLALRPYRGLLPFEPEHRRFFFGRGELEAELVLRVRAAMGGWGSRFQVVAGASGSGKSSLVRAGLVPRLRADTRDAWDVVMMRPGEAGSRWTSGTAGPGRFSSLGRLRALLAGLHRPEGAPPARTATVAEVLQEARLLRAARPGRWLLLGVDPLEELFTEVPLAREREAFVRALWKLAHAEASRVIVVSALRVEALGRCGEVRVEPRGPRLDEVVYSGEHRLFVGPLRGEPLVQGIEGPARTVGLELEAELVEQLRRDVEQEPGALPLLGHVLDRLWERRSGRLLTRAAYEELGGVAGALARTGDQLYAELSEAERHQARRLLVRWVEPREEAGPRARRWGLKEVRPEQEALAAAFDAVVEKLVRRRLVVRGVDGDGGGAAPEPWLRIAHESLSRRWERLVGWAREEWERESRAREMDERDKREEAERWRVALDVSRVLRARWLMEGDPALAARVLREVTEPERTPEWHQAALEVLQRGGVEPVVLQGHDGKVELAEFSADGQWVLTGSEDGTARVWRADGTGKPVVLAGHEGGVWSAELSADGRQVLTTSQEGRVRMWRADGTAAPILLAGHEERVWPTEFSPDGQRVLIVSEDGTVRVARVEGAGEPVMLRGHEGGVRTATFSADGQRVLTASEDGTARVWKAEGGGIPVVLRGHARGVRSAEFSADGQRVLTASEDGTARVWRADGTGKPVVLAGHAGGVAAAAFSPDGRRVVTASEDGTARVWKANGKGAPLMLAGHAGGVWSVAFSPDGQRVLTASGDGTARVWKADGTGEPVMLVGHEGGVWFAEFSPDGQKVLTASEDGTARVWWADGRGAPVVLAGHLGGVWSAEFSADGQRVLTASGDGVVRVWRADGRGEPVLLRGHEGEVGSGAFSPDGQRVVTASREGTVRVWRADGAGKPVVLQGYLAVLWPAELSPDGQRVLVRSREGTVRVWRADGTGEPVLLRGHEEEVWSAEFSPDGQRVLSKSQDGTARVWRADGAGAPMVLAGHEGGLRSAEFSQDGRWVVTVSEEGTVRVWSAEAAGEPVELAGPEEEVELAAFGPDGQRVLTRSKDGTVRVWSADGTGTPVVLRGHEGRVELARFSPDGQRVLTAAQDGTARVWSADGTGEPLVLRCPEARTRFTFSADGQRVLSVSEGGTVRVWTMESAGEPVVSLLHAQEVGAAELSADGSRILLSTDQTLYLWSVGTERLQALLREAAPGCLTPEQRQRYLLETPEEARVGYERALRGGAAR